MRVGYEARQPFDDVVFGVAVFDERDGKHLYGANTRLLSSRRPTPLR